MKYIELTLIILTGLLIWKIFTSKKIDALLHKWFGEEETADDVIQNVKKADQDVIYYEQNAQRKMKYTFDELKKVLESKPVTTLKKKRVYKKKSTEQK